MIYFYTKGHRKKMERDNKKNNEVSEINNIKSSENDLLYFFLGVVLLGVGLFMLSKRVMVHSSWYIWRIGGFDLSSGTVTIPLIIGIIWYFANSKSVFPKIIITLSVIFIVLSIIMSVRINFVTTSLFDYILIIGMASAGAGLLLKTTFRKKK